MTKLTKEDKHDMWGWFVAGVVFWTGLILFLVIAAELGGVDNISLMAIWEWFNG